MNLRAITYAVAIATVAACGGDDSTDSTDGTDGSAPDAQVSVDAPAGGVTCDVTGTIVAMASARTVTGTGTATCTGAAALRVETCVQWNPSGSFADIQCMESSKSGMAALTVDNLASCGISSGRKFRSRITATVNGVAQAEVLSAEITCF